MSVLTDRLDEIKAEGRAALIAYLPVGYPDVDTSIRAMETLVEAGVDIIEVGPPYTDPLLDGSVIQYAAAHAIAGGVRFTDTFKAIEAVTAAGAPAVVMAYYNLMLQHGLENFAADVVKAGGAGVITPDVTPDNVPDWVAAARGQDLDTIFLVAPSTTRERMHMTVAASRGFVYATSIMGVTGRQESVGEHAERVVSEARAAGAERVCVGLGVSNADHAAEVARYADGVIVGTALVRCLVDNDDGETGLAELAKTAAELAEGVRRGR